MTIFSKIARAKYLAWRSEKNKRSYQEKIERGECGHCSEPLAPNSKSCCVKHLEYFKHKTRNARGVQSNITALAARTSTFPKPADVRRVDQCPIRCIPSSVRECLPSSFYKYIAFRPELDSCWHWTGQTICNPRYKNNSNGQRYGFYTRKVRREGGGWITKGRTAHKFLYEALVGQVPVGRELDHLCDNKLCVNPQHLEPVTHQVNVIRGLIRRGAL